MGKAWRVIVLVVVGFSLLSMYQVEAQTDEVIVSSDLELLSLGDAAGGGRVTWVFAGEQATLLRAKLLRMHDERSTWPRGFPFECQVTGATPTSVANGRLENAEATQFLAYLEREIEGQFRTPSGTTFRFTHITRADVVEQGLPADASSTGLVDTTFSTRQNIEIRFIFNANAQSLGRVFNQMNESLANAAHTMFTFDAFDQTDRPCGPFWFPFPARGGWWRVPPPDPALGAGDFLWHGNRSAIPGVDRGAYERDARNETFYSEGGVAMTRVDLRFATDATLSFEHTGGAAQGDELLVQVSTDVNRTVWTNLIAANDGDQNPAVDTLPLDVSVTSSFDLGPYVGQSVDVRLVFDADGDSVTGGYGYFIRNIRIRAPSTIVGAIEHNHIDFVVGFLSFSGFQTTSFGAHLIRTPVGEIQFYNARFASGSPPRDTARFAIFDFLENPQVLFVLLAVSWWLIGFFQTRFYERFRIDHPTPMRVGVAKTKWVHWLGKIVVLLLVLAYFFPTMFGAGLFISGGAYWGLCIGSVVGLSVFTWFWYDRRSKHIPPEPGPATEGSPADLPPPPPAIEEIAALSICAHCAMEIEDPLDIFSCECGQVYHKAHAAELGTCGNCGRKLEVVPQPGETMVTIKCPWCGELQVVEEGTALKATRCEQCRMVLEEIPQRYNYLVITEKPALAYDWFKAVCRQGAPGLVMSTTFPEKLKREFELPEQAELYWLSDTNPGARTLDPRRLDFEIMRALSNFLKNNKEGTLVLDGLEYLIVENSFDRVLKFIKKVNDLASVHDATMFVPVTPTGLGPEEMTLLRKEFDKVETISETTPS